MVLLACVSYSHGVFADDNCLTPTQMASSGGCNEDYMAWKKCRDKNTYECISCTNDSDEVDGGRKKAILVRNGQKFCVSVVDTDFNYLSERKISLKDIQSNGTNYSVVNCMAPANGVYYGLAYNVDLNDIKCLEGKDGIGFVMDWENFDDSGRYTNNLYKKYKLRVLMYPCPGGWVIEQGRRYCSKCPDAGGQARNFSNGLGSCYMGTVSYSKKATVSSIDEDSLVYKPKDEDDDNKIVDVCASFETEPNNGYLDLNSSECVTKCPNGTYAKDYWSNSGTDNDQNWWLGYGWCEACPSGKYSYNNNFNYTNTTPGNPAQRNTQHDVYMTYNGDDSTKHCFSSCPTWTIASGTGGKHCEECPYGTYANRVGGANDCVIACPNGTYAKTEGNLKYCATCDGNQYAYFSTDNTSGCYDICPDGTESVLPADGKPYCKPCGDDKLSIVIESTSNQTTRTICIPKSDCGKSTGVLKFFEVDGKACKPKCDISADECNKTSIIPCPAGQGFDKLQIAANTLKSCPEGQGQFYDTICNALNEVLKNFDVPYYGCRECNAYETLTGGTGSKNPVCASCANNEVMWLKEGDNEPRCHSCSDLNMQDGCSVARVKEDKMILLGIPSDGYYFENIQYNTTNTMVTREDRDKIPVKCTGQTDNGKQLWFRNYDVTKYVDTGKITFGDNITLTQEEFNSLDANIKSGLAGNHPSCITYNTNTTNPCTANKPIKCGDENVCSYNVCSANACPQGQTVNPADGKCTACTTPGKGYYEASDGDDIYHDFNTNYRCGTCPDGTFLAYMCSDSIIRPECAGGKSVSYNICVDNSRLEEILDNAQDSMYKRLGYLNGKTIEKCTFNTFVYSKTGNTCSLDECKDGTGVGIGSASGTGPGTGTDRLCKICEPGHPSTENGSISKNFITDNDGVQRCDGNCNGNSPLYRLLTSSSSYNSINSSATVIDKINSLFYYSCQASGCSFDDKWGYLDGSCVDCTKQGSIAKKDASSGNYSCEICPDGTGFDNGECKQCTSTKASFKGKCLKFNQLVKEICGNNECATTQPFSIDTNSEARSIQFDTANFELKDGIVAYTGSGGKRDNPHRYMSVDNKWTPCVEGCCWAGSNHHLADKTGFWLPGMACVSNGIVPSGSSSLIEALSLLNSNYEYPLKCDDINPGFILNIDLSKNNDMYKDAVAIVPNNYTTEVTGFIKGDVCTKPVEISKFCDGDASRNYCFVVPAWMKVNSVQTSNLEYSIFGPVDLKPDVNGSKD